MLEFDLNFSIVIRISIYLDIYYPFSALFWPLQGSDRLPIGP